MFDISPSIHVSARRACALAAVLLTLAAGAALAEGERRHGVVEQRVDAAVLAVHRLRAAPAEARAARVAALIDRTVDVRAWLGDAVPGLEALPEVDQAALLGATRRLLVARATRHLAVAGQARVEIEKTRVEARGVAVDCLVHAGDATYEIALRWSSGPRPRLRDVLVEGVSVGAADRRGIRRAWDAGGLPATLEALERAAGRIGVSGPPAIATRTRSGARRHTPAPPPSSARPPGL